MANRQGKGKITYTLQAAHIIPLLLSMIVIAAMATNRFTNSMYSQVENELEHVSHTLVTMYDMLYPGDFSLSGEESLRFYKGDADLTSDFSLIDRVKDDTGLDITIFYQDTRILTTITGTDGQRIIGSGAPEIVAETVLPTGEPYYNENILIYGDSYFSYYAPLFQQDGSVIGMVFVGKPCKDVNNAIRKTVMPLIAVDFILTLAILVFLFLHTQQFTSPLLKIHDFLRTLSAGNTEGKLEPAITERGDELGDMARFSLTIQNSLNSMLNQDNLTTLANRRTGTIKLRQTIKNHKDYGTPFCIALGNIDYFKKINDTFGQDYGDLILKNVSEKLQKHMHGKGLAARWSGEEFLLIFENMSLDASAAASEAILADIRSMINRHNDKRIKVTMTIGLTKGDEADNMTDLLRLADEKLRQGKLNGRNQLVK